MLRSRKKLLLVFVLLTGLNDVPLSSQDSSLLVSDLLTQIQLGINKAKVTVDMEYRNVPPLDSVTLVLQTETQTTGGGGINLWFVKIGGGGSKGSSSQMTLVLKPAASKGAPISAQKLDETIAQTLIGAAKGVHDAQTGPNGIPLLLNSLTADFAFTVSKKFGGGVEFKILPIGGSVEAGHSTTDTHKISVKFASQ